MLEHYLQVQGREWERFAWLKSRVVAPRASVESGRALALRELVTPFVYRRYLDYGVFESLRQLHRKGRDEAQRRAQASIEQLMNDYKSAASVLSASRAGSKPAARSTPSWAARRATFAVRACAYCT